VNKGSEKGEVMPRLNSTADLEKKRQGILAQRDGLRIVSVTNGTDATISDVPDSDISGLDSIRGTKNISKHETQCKDKKDHQN